MWWCLHSWAVHKRRHINQKGGGEGAKEIFCFFKVKSAVPPHPIFVSVNITNVCP